MALTFTTSDLLKLTRSPRNPCFVCGPTNPAGLRVEFSIVDETVRASFTPTLHHQGWQGVVHGGVLAALLDEAMAYTLFSRQLMAVTARMEVRYRAPARAGETISVEARCTLEKSRIADVEGRLLRGDEVLAEATARFVKIGMIDPETLFTEPT